MTEQTRYCAEDIEIYKEICANIRVTDEISFRLLAAVPLASTVLSGGLLLVEGTKPVGNLTPVGVVFLSLLGAMVTMGLFRWELRNVRWCRWLISRAADFERNVLAGGAQHVRHESPTGYSSIAGPKRASPSRCQPSFTGGHGTRRRPKSSSTVGRLQCGWFRSSPR